MTSKLTRERLEKIKSWRETYGAGSNVMLPAEEAEELARIALAAMESEPVAWVSSGALDSRLAGIEAVTIPFVPGMDIPLFRHPVVTHDGDCDADIFGFARRSGDLVVIDVNGDPHVRDGMPLYRHAQPVLEIESEPVFTLEVARADYKGQKLGNHFGFITLDAARELKEGNYQLYTAQPAPVVPKEMTAGIAVKHWEGGRGSIESFVAGYNFCRAAMLQAEPVTTANKLGNSPVIPDTWIPVSERMPEDEQEVLTINRMGHRFVSFFDKHSGLFFDSLDAPAACCIEHVLVTHWMPLPAAPQEVK